MNNKFLCKILLLILILLNIKITIVSAATVNNEDLKVLNDKIMQLEKENKSLRDDLSKISKDKLIESYKEQNESILKSTDACIKNLTIIIAAISAVITLLAAVGTIAFPVMSNKKEKERSDEIKNKISEIEKSLDLKIQSVTMDLTNKESSIIALDEKLSSLVNDVNELLRKASTSAEEAKKSQDISKSYSLSSEAAKLYENKKFDLAIEKFNNAIELNPNDTNILYNRGVVYQNLEKYDLALLDYNKVLEIDPNYLDALSNRGVLYRNLGKYDLALLDYNKVLEINPNDASTLFNRGNLYGDELKKYDLALQDYTKALEINPNHLDCTNNRANLYRETGRLDLASQEIAAALSIDSNDPFILSTAAEIALAKGDKEEFYKYIKKALEKALPLSIISGDDIYKKVLDEPRFKELLEKYKNNNI